MDSLSIAIAAAGLLIYSLFSGRLQGTIITAPLAFVVFGYAIGINGFNIARLYGQFAKRMGECEENQEIVELPLRNGHINALKEIR